MQCAPRRHAAQHELRVVRQRCLGKRANETGQVLARLDGAEMQHVAVDEPGGRLPWGPVSDIAAASHLSSLDYIGDVPWDEYEPAKEWYARIKSRPSFRQILADHVPGTAPPKHYADLDF